MKFFPICVSTILTVCLAQSTVELEGKLQNVIDQTALLKKKHMLLTQLEQIDSQLGIYGDYDIQLKDDKAPETKKECACANIQDESKKENKPKSKAHETVSPELKKRREEISKKEVEYAKKYNDAIEKVKNDKK